MTAIRALALVLSGATHAAYGGQSVEVSDAELAFQGRYENQFCGSVFVHADHLLFEGKRIEFDVATMKGVTNLVVSSTLRYIDDSGHCRLQFIDEAEYIPLLVEGGTLSFDVQSVDRSRVQRFEKVN